MNLFKRKSTRLAEADERSYRDIRSLLSKAISGKFGNDSWIDAVFDTYTIFESGDKLFRVDYEIGDNNKVKFTNDSKEVVKKEEFVEITEACPNKFGLGSVELIEAAEDTKTGSAWKVRIIKAGLSCNGINYTADILREAAPKFNGVRSHAISDSNHLNQKEASVNNIVGWFENTTFSESSQSIEGLFHISEAAPRLKTMLADAWSKGKKDLVSLSIVAYGKLGNPQLTESGMVRDALSIEIVKSVDVIEESGAGGEFIEMIAAKGEETETEKDMKFKERLLKMVEAKRPEIYAKLDKENVTDAHLTELLAEAVAAPSVQKVEHPAQKVTPSGEGLERIAEAEKSIQGLTEKLAIQQSDMVLGQRLAESKLPPDFSEILKNKYKGHVFDLATLNADIEANKKALSRFTESGNVTGLGAGQIEVGKGEIDKTILALDGFFEAKDVGGVPRAKSFRKIFAQITGDEDITFQKNKASRLHLFTEALTVSSWAELFGDSVTRRMLREYNLPELQGWRDLVGPNITSVSDFRTQRRMRLGGFPNLPIVAERGSYTDLTDPTDEEATFAAVKRGGKAALTREMIKNDDVGAIRRIPINLGRAAANTLYQFVFDFLRNNGNIYDAMALFAGGHNNLLVAALSAPNLSAARLQMKKQTAYGTSTEVMGLAPWKLWVPADLEELAYQLTGPVTVVGSAPNFHSTYNMQPKVVPYWTDVNNWYLTANPNEVPLIEVAFMDGEEEPTILIQDNPTSGLNFTQDDTTYKIRHEYGGAVLDFRGFQGNIVP